RRCRDVDTTCMDDSCTNGLLSARVSLASTRASSAASGFDDQMAAGQRAPALLEELHVVEPPPVGAPALLQTYSGGQRLLHTLEVLHLALDLEVLDGEAALDELGAHARLVVGEARCATGLPPL